ncbi:MAG: hypothetical protein J7494_02210 [Sphingobium sp.]|nr:hypothetical protein [Sphingobium sp.]
MTRSHATAMLLASSILLLPGCGVTKVVTTPVKVASKAADWATVSGDEADRERGRELRKKCKKDPDPRYCGDDKGQNKD